MGLTYNEEVSMVMDSYLTPDYPAIPEKKMASAANRSANGWFQSW
jgi:hypothetical protein